MARINQYPECTTPADNDLLIIETEDGTRKIKKNNLIPGTIYAGRTPVEVGTFIDGRKIYRKIVTHSYTKGADTGSNPTIESVYFGPGVNEIISVSGNLISKQIIDGTEYTHYTLLPYYYQPNDNRYVMVSDNGNGLLDIFDNMYDPIDEQQKTLYIVVDYI